MILLCIDPGPESSGVVVLHTRFEPSDWDSTNFYDLKEKQVLYSDSEYNNEELLKDIQKQHGTSLGSKLDWCCHHLVIEGIQNMGMSAVGKTVFDTAEWIGIFRQAFRGNLTRSTKIYRNEVKMFLCGSMRAKGKNIRQRIIDIYPATGGGKVPQIGTKKEPGPLFGVSSHAWSALALGLTYMYSENYMSLNGGQI